MTDFVDDNVDEIATATDTVVGLPIPVGSQPIDVAVTPDGAYAYVANLNSDNVSVIDTATTRWWPRCRWGPAPTGWPSPPTAPGPT